MRHHAKALTDVDYANDICLLSNQVQQVWELLTRVELEYAEVGVMLKCKEHYL